MEVLAEAKSNLPALDLKCLQRLVDARERDLGYPSFPTLNTLASFAADTQAPLIQAFASALVHVDSNSSRQLLVEAANYAGESIGLTILLRGAPAHAVNRQTYVPADLLHQTKVNHREILSGAEEAAQLYSEIAGRAERALALAEDAALDTPREVRPAFWGLQLPRIYLKRLRGCKYNPFNERLQRSMLYTYPLQLQLAILWKRFLGR